MRGRVRRCTFAYLGMFALSLNLTCRPCPHTIGIAHTRTLRSRLTCFIDLLTDEIAELANRLGGRVMACCFAHARVEYVSFV